MAVLPGTSIERCPRTPGDDTLFERITVIEYDQKYDRILAVVLFGIRITAFANILFSDPRNGLEIV